MPSSNKTRQGIFFNDFSTSYIPDILEEIYKKKVYQQFVLGRKDMIIVDVGGNIGLTSFYFKDYASKVYCVEPSKEHLDIINYMIEYNKIDNIVVCPVALSNKNGTTKFYHNENVTMFSMESSVNNKDDFEEVETVTIKELMKRNNLEYIDLLKLDVEGSEGLVIASDEFKEVCSKIKVICGEWHSWCPMSKDLFMNTFRDLGYEFTWRNDTAASVFEATRI